jgi:hypothetical protein
MEKFSELNGLHHTGYRCRLSAVGIIKYEGSSSKSLARVGEKAHLTQSGVSRSRNFSALFAISTPGLLDTTMPSISTDAALDFHIVGGHPESRTRLSEPLVYSGTLDRFEQNDLTPVIGREYYGLQIRDLLAWDDQHLRDLAVTSELFA